MCMINGGILGEKVSEGEQKQALFLLGVLSFPFLSFSSRTLGTATIPLSYVHTFFIRSRLSGLFFS